MLASMNAKFVAITIPFEFEEFSEVHPPPSLLDHPIEQCFYDLWIVFSFLPKRKFIHFCKG